VSKGRFPRIDRRWRERVLPERAPPGGAWGVFVPLVKLRKDIERESAAAAALARAAGVM
jgi:hypothetical protein